MQVLLLILLAIGMIFGREGLNAVFVPIMAILLFAALLSIGWACVRQLRLKFRS